MKSSKNWLLVVCALLLAFSFGWTQPKADAASGFFVSGSALKDANGNTFVMRGVNNPHAWYDTQAYDALTAIAATGANTVRIVWQTSGTAARLQQIVDRCKALKLVAVVELHDVTGSNDANRLNDMAKYFASSAIKTILVNNQKYVIVNIANEWGGSDLTDAAWASAYKTAISTLRNAGIPNTIMIDGSGWGQNSSPIKAYGQTLLNYDPSHNVMFSIHMYGSWNDTSRIGNEMWNIQQLGLALTVGEFGYNYNNGSNNLGCKVDYQEIMNQATWKGVGYMAWSWTGNDSSNAWLDLASSGDWKTLTTWGNNVVNGTNGIKATSKKATVY